MTPLGTNTLNKQNGYMQASIITEYFQLITIFNQTMTNEANLEYHSKYNFHLWQLGTMNVYYIKRVLFEHKYLLNEYQISGKTIKSCKSSLI